MPRRLLLSSLLAGCAAAPTPIAGTPQRLAVTYERGSEDAAAANAPAPAEPAPSRRLDVAAFAVASPPDSSEPVDTAIAFIAASRGAPFRGASTLVHGMRVLGPPRSAAWIASAAAPVNAVSVGALEVVLAATLVTRIGLGDLPLPDVIATLADDALAVTLTAKRRDAGPDELVRLAIAPRGDGETIVLFAPSPAPGRAGYAVALTLGPRPPDPIVQAAMNLADAGAAKVDSAPFSLTLARQLEVAKRSIGARNRLGAMLALATRLDLPRCIDLLLAADEPVLIAITEALPEPGEPGLAEHAPWRTERAMWTATLPALQRGEASPALLACTRRQLGAAALDHSALHTLLATSSGPDAFAAGLHDENLAALDDPDAATRLQAHAWLTKRGGAVAGYDPLAGRDARREALSRQPARTPRTPGAGQ